MKLQDLNGSVLTLVLVAILLGVGLTVLGVLSTNVRTSANYVNDTIYANNVSCETFTNTYITTTTGVTYQNTSTSVDSSCFTWDNTGTFAGTCVTLSTSCNNLNGTKINVTYSYGASSTAQSSVDSAITATGGFSSWFAIIVVILVAAIIIGLVIRSFSGK